jgi:hypothetical protein
MPPVAPKIASARTRCGPDVEAWIVAKTCGTIAAAAAPWSTRARTSTPSVGARPQSNEVTVNATRPTTNIRRRPNASPSRPPSTSSAA